MSVSHLSRVRLAGSIRNAQLLSRPSQHVPNRPLSISARRQAEQNPNPQHDAQENREKINTDANEYAKSGTDDTAASNEEAAFDPEITNPQEAKKKAGEGNEVNPLDASPANPELGQPTREASKEPTKDERRET